MATEAAVKEANKGQSAEAFQVSRRENGIAVITIDVPGEAQNTLKAELVEPMAATIDTLSRDSSVKGIVFISGKPGSFIAGADINMLQRCQTAAEVTGLSEGGQQFFDMLAGLEIPVVAAIDGACLGGGLELALACHARVASDSPKTVLGLPEVMLGLLPGSGGTQRLPRLIGLPNALDLMLTGKQVKAAKAKKLGIVDEVVPATILLDAAVARLGKLQGKSLKRERKLSPKDWALEGNKLGRKVVFDQARKTLEAKTKGNYPAPFKILEVVRTGLEEGIGAGLKAEAKAFGELAMTPEARQLINIYFATTAMKKDTGVEDPRVEPRRVERVAVLGAGLMGAGIGYVTLSKAGIPVRLKDVKAEGLSRGVAHINDEIQKRKKRRALTQHEAELQRNRLTATLDYSGFKHVDMVIEAVFEDLNLKHQMVKDVEANCPEHTIFATNTSSIPITDIAKAAKRPENVIGMHYFSPVEKMPLLEVIATDKTSPEVIATTVETGKKQGKTVIVVKDGAGFYVNRILSPYMNEATRLLSEGVAIDRVDRTLVKFGFPVGPFALLDEVGIDVGSKVAPILHEAFGERMKPVDSAGKMLKDGRYGKKSKKGFYKYENTKKKGKKEVDEAVYGLLGVSPDNEMGEQEIIDRTVLLMINEAALCYEEGVIRNLRDGDVGAIFGIGFPPFLGGPFRYADSRGIKEIVVRLRELETEHGMRYAPAPILVKMADEGRRFHES